MTQVLNPVLLIEEPLYEILLGGEVLGRSPLAGRDSGMGLALGPFTPTFAFTKVEDVFALFAEASKDAGDTSKVNEYYKKRDALGLKLRSPEGADIATDGSISLTFAPSSAPMPAKLKCIQAIRHFSLR